MSEPKQAKPTEHADRGCVLRLANAIYDVVYKADLWESEVHVYQAESPRTIKKYEPVKKAKEALRRAIDAAVDAIPGTDYYVRQMRDTKPGVWSSRLKADLRYFGAELIAHGDSWLSNAPGPYWAGPDPKEVANKDRDYRTWWHAFHHEQLFLRNLDVSALEPAQGGALPDLEDVKADLAIEQGKQAGGTGLLPAQARKPAHAAPSTAGARDKVFISYSHKDKKFLDELLAHLKPMIREERISIWSDKQIKPRAKWFDDIKLALASTKIAVLLVTSHFLASDFIQQHELTPLLKAAREGEVSILWIPVRACAYKETPLKDYHALIPPDKPLAEMNAERDSAWVKICEAIKAAL